MITSDPIGEFPSAVELKGDRIVLRTLQREHLDQEAGWPEYTEPIYRHYNQPHTPADLERKWQQWCSLFDLNLGIFESDALVGYIGLYATKFRRGISEMGIQMASNQRSKGYCKDALKILSDAFFRDWGMNLMKLEVAAFNAPGIRCYEQSGFVTARRFWHPNAYQRYLDYENDPRLSEYAHFFRKAEMGVEVEYLEMHLVRDHYLEMFPQKELLEGGLQSLSDNVL